MVREIDGFGRFFPAQHGAPAQLYLDRGDSIREETKARIAAEGLAPCEVYRAVYRGGASAPCGHDMVACRLLGTVDA